jgi:hypothetical protein
VQPMDGWHDQPLRDQAVTHSSRDSQELVLEGMYREIKRTEG